MENDVFCLKPEPNIFSAYAQKDRRRGLAVLQNFLHSRQNMVSNHLFSNEGTGEFYFKKSLVFRNKDSLEIKHLERKRAKNLRTINILLFFVFLTEIISLESYNQSK